MIRRLALALVALALVALAAVGLFLARTGERAPVRPRAAPAAVAAPVERIVKVRLRIELTFDGEPLVIERVIGCGRQITRGGAGVAEESRPQVDRAMVGTRVGPAKTEGVAVAAGAACRPREMITPDYLPLIVYLPDADAPDVLVFYASRTAYQSAKARIQFKSFKSEVVTDDAVPLSPMDGVEWIDGWGQQDLYMGWSLIPMNFDSMQEVVARISSQITDVAAPTIANFVAPAESRELSSLWRDVVEQNKNNPGLAIFFQGYSVSQLHRTLYGPSLGLMPRDGWLIFDPKAVGLIVVERCKPEQWGYKNKRCGLSNLPPFQLDVFGHKFQPPGCQKGLPCVFSADNPRLLWMPDEQVYVREGINISVRLPHKMREFSR